jgi:hypothetical protein
MRWVGHIACIEDVKLQKEDASDIDIRERIILKWVFEK